MLASPTDHPTAAKAPAVSSSRRASPSHMKAGFRAASLVALTLLIVARAWPADWTSRLVARLSGEIYLDEVDVVRQATRYDCGVAALIMLISGHGGRLGVATDLVMLSRRQGELSFNDLVRAARVAGHPVRGVATSFARLGDLPMPILVHFPGHFLVLDSLRDHAAYLRDPAVGRVRMADYAFRRRWSGHAIIWANDVAGAWARQKPPNGHRAGNHKVRDATAVLGATGRYHGLLARDKQLAVAVGASRFPRVRPPRSRAVAWPHRNGVI